MKENVTSFSVDSASYAAHRPSYPKALFDWISDKAPAHQHVWDCGTGNGQAAASLANVFDAVSATDLSLEQVEAAQTHDRISFSAQPAEKTNFEANSFDAVTVAQALHWFDFKAFWKEVRRVARPGALFCAWGYVWFEGDQLFNTRLIGPVREIVEPFWSDRNRLMWRGYANDDIQFPFERLEVPPLRLTVDWSVGETIAHIKTWSAYKRAYEDSALKMSLDHVFETAVNEMGIETQISLQCPLITVAGHIV